MDLRRERRALFEEVHLSKKTPLSPFVAKYVLFHLMGGLKMGSKVIMVPSVNVHALLCRVTPPKRSLQSNY